MHLLIPYYYLNNAYLCDLIKRHKNIKYSCFVSGFFKLLALNLMSEQYSEFSWLSQYLRLIVINASFHPSFNSSHFHSFKH